MTQAVLALADGTVFVGESFGAAQKVVGEVVFNTSMFGYQEILTDPSYAGQIVTMAYPEMGNVGTNALDAESAGPHAVGMAVRALSSRPSNWRSELPLEAFLEKHGRAGISGIDTRRLVRHLRTRGSQMGVLASGDKLDINALVDEAREAPGMEGQDLVSGISTREAYVFETPTPDFLAGQAPRMVTPRFEVVTIDYGLKRSMLHQLVDVGCRVTVLPSGASAEEILARGPDGVFLANGPGDPAAVPGADRTVAALLGKVP
ncbi:MAG TPA: carbamoyl phosphate synthase small subunit, partial [Myxococcaceae bacterium]|nr:carbamoyl phosphate synthase small subunit [Myxococcaceae bacterium]